MDLPELVPCERMSARLLASKCVARWRKAQESSPDPWDSLHHCSTCPIGAIRAGSTAEVATFAQAVQVMRALCPRCGRVAGRMIGNRLCTSCYNRDLEAAKGRNAKGGRPRICGQIHPERLAIAGVMQARPILVDRVMSRPEAIGVLARAGDPGLVVGVPAWLPPSGAQMELALA